MHKLNPLMGLLIALFRSGAFAKLQKAKDY